MASPQVDVQPPPPQITEPTVSATSVDPTPLTALPPRVELPPNVQAAAPTPASAPRPPPLPQKRLIRLTPQNSFVVHFFNSASEYTRIPQQILPAPLPARDLFKVLERDHRGIDKLGVLKNCYITINYGAVDTKEELMANPTLICPGDHVFLIPHSFLPEGVEPLKRKIMYRQPPGMGPRPGESRS